MFAVADLDTADAGSSPTGKMLPDGEDQVRALFEEIITAEWPSGFDGFDGFDGSDGTRTATMAPTAHRPEAESPIESADRPLRSSGRRAGPEGRGQGRSPPLGRFRPPVGPVNLRSPT